MTRWILVHLAKDLIKLDYRPLIFTSKNRILIQYCFGKRGKPMRGLLLLTLLHSCCYSATAAAAAAETGTAKMMTSRTLASEEDVQIISKKNDQCIQPRKCLQCMQPAVQTKITRCTAKQLVRVVFVLSFFLFFSLSLFLSFSLSFSFFFFVAIKYNGCCLSFFFVSSLPLLPPSIDDPLMILR